MLLAGRAWPDYGLTGTWTLRWHSDNRDNVKTNDHYLDFKQRLNLSMIEGMLEAHMRLDAAVIFLPDCNPFSPDCAPKAPAGSKYQSDYRIERLTGILRPTKNFKLTLGDFYAQMGHGILLSLRKIDEFGMETVLRGARADFSSRFVSFGLMAGVTNINNVDQLYDYFYEDPMDRVVAGRVVITPIERVKIEAMGLLLNWKETQGVEAFSLMSYGTGLMLSASILPGRLTAGAEFDVIWREYNSFPDTGFDRGEALYLNLNATAGPFSLLVEGKWYENFVAAGSLVAGQPLAYNLPPTAERMDQDIFSSSTVYGGRVKADVVLRENVSIYANFSGGDYAPLTEIAEGNDEKRSSYYLHAYGGLNLFFNQGLSQLAVSGGWRREMEPGRREDDPDWKLHKHVYHVEAKALFYLGRGWSLHYSLLHEKRGARMATRYNDYDRGTHILGVDLAGVMSLNAAFEYDTEFSRIPFRDNLYGWWEGKFYPTRSLVLVVKGGLERGGLKCVSGMCKVLPPFTGMRLDVVYRY